MSLPWLSWELALATDPLAAFFSYCHDDFEFALRLAKDLKAAGASVWLDRLDIPPGQLWDRAVEDALTNCPCMLVILSPASVGNTNVMDEVSFALEEHKTIIPILHRDCKIPLRLRRVQYLDFRNDYDQGLKALLKPLLAEGIRREGERKQAAGQSQLTPRSSSAPFSPGELSRTMSNPKYPDDILKLDGVNAPHSVINPLTIIIVVGAGVSSELLDRPVAELLRDRIDGEGGKYPFRRGVVLTDGAWYSEESVFGNNPVIAIGGPVVNTLSDEFRKWALTSRSGEGTYSISDSEKLTVFFRLNKKELPQVALWGEDANATREAVESYITNPEGLPKFLQMCWGPR
jgi:hypothetical protein